MTSREFYLERRKAEQPIFLRVLKSLPPDRLDYRPHERSPSAGQVMWTMTNELRACVDVVTRYRAEWRAQEQLPFDEMLQLFEQWSNELTEHVAKMDEASWDRVAQFYVNGKVVSEQPVSQFLWFIHFDAIHHRGQLSVYLRMLDVPLPAIYGTSADESPR